MGEFFPDRNPKFASARAQNTARVHSEKPTFRKMLPKKTSFWRKINISLKLPEFREFFSHFRETWRSGLISGDSRKFRETWQVWISCMTNLNCAACRGGTSLVETTAKLTDLSDSDIVIDMYVVCRHVIMPKRAVSY